MIDTLLTNEVISVILAIVLLLFLSTTIGSIFKKYYLPSVIGEILGGIILGPSILGVLMPGLYNYLFFNFMEEGKILNIFYWLGLILLMLISGYDMRLSFGKQDTKLITSIFIGSCILPFLAGLLIFPIFLRGFIGSEGTILNFAILFAISIAVTSIPVISKIFLDLKIINTRFAGSIIAASTIEDMLEWIVLSIIIGLSSSEKGTITSIIIILSTLALLFISIHLIPKLFGRYEHLIRNHDKVIFLFCFSYAVVSSLLFDVNILYSVLLVGIVLRKSKIVLFDKSVRKIESISLAFFIPLYFALVGLRIDIFHYFHFGRFLLYFTISTLVTIVCVIIVLSVFKINKNLIFSYAVATSAKGGPGIVLATIGFDYHIINIEFFTTLTLASIMSSLVAGWVLKLKVVENRVDFNEI